MGCDQSSPSDPQLPNALKASKYSPVQQSNPIQPDPIIHNQQVLEDEEGSEAMEGELPDGQSMIFSGKEDEKSEYDENQQEVKQHSLVSQPKQFLQASQIISKVVNFELQHSIATTTIDPNNIFDTDSLLGAIRVAVTSDKWLRSLMGQEDFSSVFKFISRNALSRQLQLQLVELMLNLLRKKKELNKNITLHEFPDVCNQVKAHGTYETKLREIIEAFNKNILQKLQYLTIPITQKQSIYSYCFFDLLFDPMFSQLQKVIETTIQMLPQNPNSICWLLIYLLNCCYSLQRNGTSNYLIQDKLKQQFNQIQRILHQNNNKYSTHTEAVQRGNTQNKDVAAQKHLNKKVILTPQQKVYFEFVESEEPRQQQLHNFIKKQIHKASQKYRSFCKILAELTKESCNYFVVQELNTSRSNLLHIEDKMMDLSLQKLQTDESVGIDQFIEKERSHISKQKQTIYKLIEGQLQFKVSCLSGSCRLATIRQINSLIDKIQREAKNSGYSVIQIQNKLYSDTLRESVVYILVEGIKCQIRLELIDNIPSRIIGAYIRQIAQSKRYSLLTGLKLLSDRLTTFYYLEQKYFVQKKRLKLREMYHLPTVQDRLNQLVAYAKVEIRDEDHIKQRWFDQAKAEFLQIYKLQPKELSRMLSITSKLSYKAANKDYKAVQQYFKQFQQQLLNMQVQVTKSNEQSHSGERKTNITLLSKIQLQILKQLGLTLMHRQKYAKSIDIWLRYIKISRTFEVGSTFEAIEAVNMMAQCHHKLGNYNQELQELQKCLLQIQDQHDYAKQKYIIILKSIGQVYALQGCTFKTLQTFNRVAQACLNKQIEDRLLQSDILKSIGLQFNKTGDYQQALLYFGKSLATIEEQSGRNSIETLPILTHIASTMQAQGEYSASLQKYNQILNIIVASKGNFSLETVDPLYGIANIHTFFKQYRQAQTIYMSCLRLIEKIKGKASAQYGQCSEKIAQIYLHTKNYSLSLKYLLKSLSIKEKFYGKDTKDSLTVIQKIIANYQQQKNHKQQDYYLRRLTNIMQKQKVNESPNKISTFNNIAHNSLIRGNYPVALNYYTKALKILQGVKGKNSIEAVAIHKQIGAAYQSQDNYKASLDKYQQCLAVLQAEKGRDNMERAEVLYQIGCVHEALRNHSKAQESFRESIYLCKKHKVKYVVYAMSCFKLAKIVQQLKNFQEALQLFTQCLPILDKIGKKQCQEAKTKIQKYRLLQGV